MPRWASQAEFEDLQLDGDTVTHRPSGSQTRAAVAVALLRSHPRPVKPHGLETVRLLNEWLIAVGSDVRVKFSAVGGGPKAWLEAGPEARGPTIEPRHT